MIKNKNLSIQAKVHQRKGNIISDMGEEKVMLSIHNGKYYNLGVIGGEIWSQIKDPVPVEFLVENLTSIYEVTREKCEEEVLSFLNLLLQENLIEIAD